MGLILYTHVQVFRGWEGNENARCGSMMEPLVSVIHIWSLNRDHPHGAARFGRDGRRVAGSGENEWGSFA